jgi:hypothetical protein
VAVTNASPLKAWRTTWLIRVDTPGEADKDTHAPPHDFAVGWHGTPPKGARQHWSKNGRRALKPAYKAHK